jgi:hypothetical protein
MRITTTTTKKTLETPSVMATKAAGDRAKHCVLHANSHIELHLK